MSEDGLYTINCLGGACPNQTDGCPPSMGSGCHIPITGFPPLGTIPDFTNLNFDWSFSNGDGFTKTGDEGGYRVSSNFFSPVIHWANLTVTRPIGGLTYPGTTYSEFYVNAGGPYCTQMENDAKWTENGAEISLGDEGYSCFKENGVPTKNCCPAGRRCVNQPGDDFGQCLIDVPAPEHCTNYATALACANYNPIVGDRDAEFLIHKQWPNADCHIKTHVTIGNIGYDIKDCMCSWNGTKCLGNYTLRKEDGTISGSCLGPVISEESNCSSLGYKSITWDATWTGPIPAPEACMPGTDEVPCLSEAILGFFGTFGIALSLAAFVMFYFARIIRGKIGIKE